VLRTERPDNVLRHQQITTGNNILQRFFFQPKCFMQALLLHFCHLLASLGLIDISALLVDIWKRLLGRPWRRWEDNIKMDLQEVWLEAWTGSTWLRIGTVGGHVWMQ